ncbi:MAG: hypothetical protein IH822_08895 [Chloroflexi bacterium]|nr:hypothetical protein [Chloroflexota bacterium]
MLVIWRDWKGEFHAFCGRQCQRHYKAWVADPNYPFEKAPSTDVSFGCLWCGGNVTVGVEWFSEEPLAAARLARRSSPRSGGNRVARRY